MKLPTIAAILLVLAVPAHAGRHDLEPTKKDVFDLYTLHYDCGWFGWTEEMEQEQAKACKDLERAVKKLNAQGYCFIGHGTIARAGRPYSQKELDRLPPGDWKKGRKHCYNLKPKRDAKILQYTKQYGSEQPYIPIWKERCKKNPALPVCKANGWDNAQ